MPAEVPRMVQRVGDDSRREAELATVRDLQRFLVILYPHGARDWPEHFLAIDAHLRRRVRDHRWLHVIAALGELEHFAAGHHLAALVARDVDVAQVLLELVFADSRPDLAVRVERVAYPQRLRSLRKQLDELVVDPLRDDDPRR